MTDQLMPILVFQVAAFVGALGQLLYKKGTLGKMRNPSSIAYFLIGMFLYIGVTLLFVLAYRLGGSVSVLYPSYAATFVWGLVLARVFSGETINLPKVVGTICVIGGICLVTL